MPSVSVNLFGSPRFSIGETSIKFEDQMGRLLAYVLLNPNKHHKASDLKDLLINLETMNGFNVTYSVGNSAIKDAYKKAGQPHKPWLIRWNGEEGHSLIRLNKEVEFDCDIWRFTDLCQDKDWLSAGKLYTDPFFDVRDRDKPFDKWLLVERKFYKNKAKECFKNSLSLNHLGFPSETLLTLAQKWVALFPEEAQAHLSLITQLGSLERWDEVERAYQAFVGSKTNMEQEGEDRKIYDLYKDLKKLAKLAEERQRNLEAQADRLPKLSGELFGRTPKLVEALTLLEDDVSLVTVTGMGGIGKTRFVTEIAHKRVSQYPNNATAFVELEPMRFESDIIAGIAKQLGYQLSDGSIEELIARLKQLPGLLLILDNAEHLPEIVADLIHKILRQCDKLTILVTSRERLSLSAEEVFKLEGLEDTESESIALFKARGATHVDHVDWEAQKNVVKSICNRLGGVPLAIELAAGLLPTWGLIELEETLRKNLDILESQLRDTPERHRSLQTVFNFSWALLDESDQLLFSELTIFAGRFRRNAAIEICSCSSQFLDQMINKSLLRIEQGLFAFHPILRQFAEKKFAKLDRDHQIKTALRDKHCTHYRTWFIEQMTSGNHLDSVALEFENVEASWQAYVRHAEPVALTPFANQLWRYYRVNSLFPKALDFLTELLELTQTADAQTKARWERLTGDVYNRLGLTKKSREHLVSAVELAGETLPKGVIGYINRSLSEFAKQTALSFRRSPSSLPSKELGYTHENTVLAYLQLGEVCYLQNDVQLSVYSIMRGLTLALQEDAPHLRALMFASSGIMCQTLGIDRRAKAHIKIANSLTQTIQNKEILAASSLRISLFNLSIGDLNAAHHFSRISREQFKEMGNLRSAGDALMTEILIECFSGKFFEIPSTLVPSLKELDQVSQNLDHQFWIVLAGAFAFCYLPLSEPQAKENIKQAISLLENGTPSPIGMILFHAIQAKIASLEGDVPRAQHEAERSLEWLGETLPTSIAIVMAYYMLAGVYLECFENCPPAEKKKFSEKAIFICKKLRRSGRSFPIAIPFADYQSGRYAYMMGHTTRATQLFTRARDLGEKYQTLFLNHQTMQYLERIAMETKGL